VTEYLSAAGTVVGEGTAQGRQCAEGVLIQARQESLAFFQALHSRVSQGENTHAHTHDLLGSVSGAYTG